MPPATVTLRLISSSISTSTVAGLPVFPPKKALWNRNLSVKCNQENHRKEQRHPGNRIQISRRDTAVLSLISLIPPLFQPSHASAAFSIGISGPKEWLKEQKRKSAKFLLAPIDASRQSLRSAYLLLKDKENNSNKDLEEVQKLLKSAARDCIVQERNSFVALQANTGVEVCTFRLIVNNAASLLKNKDPVKLEAEAILDDLIRSFTSLNSLANEADIQIASNRKRIAEALMDTITSLDKFEQGVKDCLEV